MHHLLEHHGLGLMSVQLMLLQHRVLLLVMMTSTQVCFTTIPSCCATLTDVISADNTMDIGVLIYLIASIHHGLTLSQFQTLKRLVLPPMELFHLGTHIPIVCNRLWLFPFIFILSHSYFIHSCDPVECLSDSVTAIADFIVRCRRSRCFWPL